ncbi:MAG: hypothetical protein IT305_06600 [Chloroflexi bacterium]|nr:hypothetical protein [Chloroflexota bacterium]
MPQAADARRSAAGEAATDRLPPVIQALLVPSTYSHPADAIRLHETHVSWVVLAGPYAYKVKKPVNLGFVDFTSLERRAANCADEVRLNRRLCPDVYLGVPWIIMSSDGAYTIGGAGQAVEPAVWMRRLPASGMLPHLLATGKADVGLMHRIAQRLAPFHATAATGPGVDEYGRPATVRANWEENFAQIAPFIGTTVDPVAQQAMRAAVERFLDEQHDLLVRRVERGRIRDGHGDLHAASVCVDGDNLWLFDCLEFTPRFRCADVTADVAFLSMDLDQADRHDLATAFVDMYVRESGDDELLALLPFYASYRAYVRGKVLSLRLQQTGVTGRRRDEIVASARRYLTLAQHYLETAR